MYADSDTDSNKDSDTARNYKGEFVNFRGERPGKIHTWISLKAYKDNKNLIREKNHLVVFSYNAS